MFLPFFPLLCGENELLPASSWGCSLLVFYFSTCAWLKSTDTEAESCTCSWDRWEIQASRSWTPGPCSPPWHKGNTVGFGHKEMGSFSSFPLCHGNTGMQQTAANCVCKSCCTWRCISLNNQIWKAFHFTVIVEIEHKIFPYTNLVATIFLSSSFLLYLMYILWLCCLWSFAVWVGWLSSLYVKLNFKNLQLCFYTKE